MENIPQRPPVTRPSRRWKTYAATTVAVASAAALGAAAVQPDSRWYRALAKPPWQPPSWAFGAVWTPLYATVAWAAGHALVQTEGREHDALAVGLGINLTVNAAWNWMFFGLRSTRAGLLGTLLLDVSNAELIRRVRRTDPTAAAALLPYAAWCAFATALNADIARRNARGR